ncbi:hypothetical protein BDY21DRAFT_796 [Lineolata rhizophorae]|uniref:Uncharacterized protein n=1 Tax=Lineolata rhizophorae TaxID=578093 RepID=A0A6A6PCV4_9PEZI|nr:hypothetical protein BDY21DRAFT_796 [Lineolata rhizophorae]
MFLSRKLLILVLQESYRLRDKLTDSLVHAMNWSSDLMPVSGSMNTGTAASLQWYHRTGEAERLPICEPALSRSHSSQDFTLHFWPAGPQAASARANRFLRSCNTTFLPLSTVDTSCAPSARQLTCPAQQSATAPAEHSLRQAGSSGRPASLTKSSRSSARGSHADGGAPLQGSLLENERGTRLRSAGAGASASEFPAGGVGKESCKVQSLPRPGEGLRSPAPGSNARPSWKHADVRRAVPCGPCA